MVVEIDKLSGFCPGVVAAIEKAESGLSEFSELYSIGSIMHNKAEMNRLSELGLQIASLSDIKELKGKRVLIRAHGEPPSTYRLCSDSEVEVIDATCPVVATLQKRVRTASEEMKKIYGQVVILGKHGHPEVVGLKGQIADAIVVNSVEELEKFVDFSRPIYFLSQTTQSVELFEKVAARIKEAYRDKPPYWMVIKDTICRQVSNRYPHLTLFAKKYDVIIFVSGSESSNGKALFEVCRGVNLKSYKIESVEDIDMSWFVGVDSVGICGATSTPKWLMEEVR